jgi:hypothetical protein
MENWRCSPLPHVLPATPRSRRRPRPKSSRGHRNGTPGLYGDRTTRAPHDTPIELHAAKLVRLILPDNESHPTYHSPIIRRINNASGAWQTKREST